MRPIDPDTWCAACYEAEVPRGRRLLEHLLDVLLGRAPTWHARELLVFTASFTGTLRAALGYPAPSPYDRHYDDFIATGELIHLERMLRHVQ